MDNAATDYERAIGIIVQEDSKVSLKACLLRSTVQCGVSVGKGCMLSAVCSTVQNACQAAFSCYGDERSRMSVSNCSSINSKIGFMCYGAYPCTIERTTVENCTIGISMHYIRGPAVVRKCAVKQFSTFGVCVRGCMSSVRVAGLTITNACTESPSEDSEPTQGIRITDSPAVSVVSCALKSGSTAISVRAMGKDTKITVDSCQMTSKTGVQLMNGASLSMFKSSTSFCSHAGVMLNEGASVKLVNCTSTSDASAVYSENSFVDMEGCSVTNVGLGVDFRGKGGPEAYIKRCTFTSTPDRVSTAINLRSEGQTVYASDCSASGFLFDTVLAAGVRDTVYLTNCRIFSCYWHGVGVAGQHCSAFLKGCRLIDLEGFGVMCLQGSVVAERTHTARNIRGGFSMYGTGSMLLRQCSSDSDTVGVTALGKFEEVHKRVPLLSATEVLVQRSKQSGFSISGRVCCRIQNCCTMACGKEGLHLSGWDTIGPQPAVHCVRSSLFSKSGEQGVWVTKGTMAKLENVWCHRSKSSGYLVAEAAKVLLKKCLSTKNSAYPFLCDPSGGLECLECLPNVGPRVIPVYTLAPSELDSFQPPEGETFTVL